MLYPRSFSNCCLSSFFFFNDTATTEIYTLSLHDALPISPGGASTGPLHRPLSRGGQHVIATFQPSAAPPRGGGPGGGGHFPPGGRRRGARMHTRRRGGRVLGYCEWKMTSSPWTACRAAARRARAVVRCGGEPRR